MQYRNLDKQVIKQNGYTALAKITIVGTDTVFTEDDYIVNWNYEDYRYVPDTGFIGQFVERLLDGNLQNIPDGVALEDEEINLQIGIVNALDNQTTWYDYGNFLITKVQKEDTSGNYSFESSDYTKKFNKVFDGDYTDTTYTKSFNEKIEDEETVTALWLAQYVCAQAGVILGTTNFVNYDFVISSNQYDSDETLRKVIQDIAKLGYTWARIGVDNKLYLDFTPKSTSSVDTYDTLTTDEYYVSQKSDLVFGPVNKVIIGMENVDGENMYETSPSYTPETECAIEIWDNNLTNTEELRALALNGCDRLFGLTYTPIEIDTIGHPWLEGDELIKLTNVDNEVIYTYPFNRKITYSGYIEGSISSDTSTAQNKKFQYKSDIVSKVKKTSVIVDKQEQTITALAANVDENTSDISQLEIDLDGISTRVTSVENTEVTAVTNEYAVNTSATNPPAQSSSSWSTTQPTRGTGEYIWARIKTTYKSGNVEYSDPVNTTGDKGDPGAGGKGISSINNYYKTTNNQTAPSASSITSTTIPTMDATDNKYLWQKEVITYTDNTNKTTVNLIGVYGNTGQQGPQGETGQTGATGATGNGIQSITYYYKATSTQTAPSAANITSTTIPTLDATTNKYLWQKEVIKYTDSGTSDKVTVLLAGVYGDTGQQGQTGPAGADGKGISSVTYYYKATSTQTAPSASSITSTTIPTLDATTNKYLWQKEVIAYTTGDPKTTVSLSGVYGDKGNTGDTGPAGADGNGIQSITYYYATTTTQSAPAASSVTSTTIPTLSATNKYLWQKEVIKYTATGSTDKVTVALIGVYGDKGDTGSQGPAGSDGASINTITEYYAVSDNNSTAPTTWTTDLSSLTLTSTNKYLWNYEVITYTEGKQSTETAKAVIGVYGDTGQQGQTGPAGSAGRGISSITQYYLATSASSGVTRNTSGWTTTIQTMTATNKYLWNYQKIVYTSGTTTEYTTPCIIGVFGVDGSNGKGIQSVTELYYVSNSSTAPSKPSSHVTTSSLTAYNAWNLQCPPYTTTYKYFYTCSEVLYTDNTYGWTNVVQNQGLAIANQNAYNADTKATSAKTYTDAVSSQYGYRYKKDIVIYGDAENKFYPVYFAGGNQNVPRELMIIRGYSEQAPASWNTSTHKGGLMFRAKANYGGWGGVTYTCEILDFTEMYSNMIANMGVSVLSGYGCVIYMRGGGTTGAIYHIYSDQPIDVEISSWHATFPYIGTTAGAVIGYYGGDTPETATQKWLAANPLTAPNTTNLTTLQTKKALAALDTYVDTNIQNLQSQIDGAIQFWNGANIPTLSNYPANQWTTEADRTNHQADIYTVIQDVSGELKQGKSYRFDKVSGTWQWIELTDNELSAVQALAASKAKVYVVQPTPPYNVGDLWLNNNKLYKCKTAKVAGTSYAAADWELATDYTNDDTANEALDKIVNMVIGGRNYYLESDTFTAAGSGAEGITPSIVNNEWKIVVTASNGNWHTWSHSNIIEDNFKTGDKFTFSFEIKSANANITRPPRIYFKSGMGYYDTIGTVSSNWSRVYYTGTWNDTNSISTHFGWQGLSGTYYIRKLKFEVGDKATDWTLAPEDVEGDINAVATSLQSYVTTETYNAGINNTKEYVETYANANFVTTSAFGTYQEQLNTKLSQKADTTQISSTATQIVNDAMSGISQTISNVEETFTFNTNGLEIARSGNTMSLLLQNDRMSFMNSGTEKAYMTSNSFVLSELNQLQLGNYAFVVRANGSIDFKKVK